IDADRGGAVDIDAVVSGPQADDDGSAADVDRVVAAAGVERHGGIADRDGIVAAIGADDIILRARVGRQTVYGRRAAGDENAVVPAAEINRECHLRNLPSMRHDTRRPSGLDPAPAPWQGIQSRNASPAQSYTTAQGKSAGRIPTCARDPACCKN